MSRKKRKLYKIRLHNKIRKYGKVIQSFKISGQLISQTDSTTELIHNQLRLQKDIKAKFEQTGEDIKLELGRVENDFLKDLWTVRATIPLRRKLA